MEAVLLYVLHSVQDADSTKIPSSTSSLVSKGLLDSSPGTNLDKWSFHPLLEVSCDLDLIEDKTAIQARLARGFRNLIHPGVSIRKNTVCNRGTALSTLAGLEHIIDDLSDNSP